MLGSGREEGRGPRSAEVLWFEFAMFAPWHIWSLLRLQIWTRDLFRFSTPQMSVSPKNTQPRAKSLTVTTTVHRWLCRIWPRRDGRLQTPARRVDSSCLLSRERHAGRVSLHAQRQRVSPQASWSILVTLASRSRAVSMHNRHRLGHVCVR